jgi:tyrosyl-tRNA synthetase
MGKSLGNYVGVGEPAQEQFDKIMSIPDDLMKPWFELLTDHSAAEIVALTNSEATHPKIAKQTLAKDIVAFYHSAEAADKACAEWERRFSGKQDPTDIPEFTFPANELTDGKMMLTKLMTRAGLTASNGEARRLIKQGGVTIGPDRAKVTDENVEIEVTDALIIRVGNRKIVRIRLP